MSRATVAVSARCQGCGACLLTCPAHAIRPLGGLLLVRAELCTGCLECVEVCPVDAIDETDRMDRINQTDQTDRTDPTDRTEFAAGGA